MFGRFRASRRGVGCGGGVGWGLGGRVGGGVWGLLSYVPGRVLFVGVLVAVVVGGVWGGALAVGRVLIGEAPELEKSGIKAYKSTFAPI